MKALVTNISYGFRQLRAEFMILQGDSLVTLYLATYVVICYPETS